MPARCGRTCGRRSVFVRNPARKCDTSCRGDRRRLRSSAVLFFKFGGLATLLRQAFGGQASESESSVDMGEHPHGGHLEAGIAARVSVRIEQHQIGRAGGGFISLGSELPICRLSKKSGQDDRPQGAVGRQKDMPFAVG